MKYIGEIALYSCTPRIVEQIMLVAVKKRFPIKVIDVLDNQPNAVEIILNDFGIVNAIMQIA